MSVGFIVDEASYCNSKKRPALDAVGVVRDLVVVSVSNTKAARESFVDSGVEENERIEDNRCERMVVLPEPDSPLPTISISHAADQTALALTGRLLLDSLLFLLVATTLFRPGPQPRP